MNLAFESPWWLALLPLALIAFVNRGEQTVRYSSLSLIPEDFLSKVIDWTLKLLLCAGLIAIVIGQSNPYQPATVIEKIGEGAQTVLLLDSSGSMDRPFSGEKENRGRVSVWGTYTSKGQLARRILSEYVSKRAQDMFAFFVFSGNPIPVLPLTDKQAVVQSAIEAGSIERGLASTNLGGGLIQSLDYFKDKPFTGSRIVMLVSDGAARLTPEVEDQVAHLLEKYRVTLYWIYLRDRHGPGLHTEMGTNRAKDIAPEQIVHQFFSNLETPYRAFSAEDPTSLEQAVAEVDKLQKLPIKYLDVEPRRSLQPWFFAFAIACLLVVLVAKLMEVRQWQAVE
ncbi:MAG: vWA domain-containing protein [Pseudomonadota bacterium]